MKKFHFLVIPYGHSSLQNVRMKDWSWNTVSKTVVFTELERDQNFTNSEVMDYFKQQYFFFSCLKDFSVSKMTL